MIWKKQPIENQIAALNSNFRTNLTIPVTTDANGNGVLTGCSVLTDRIISIYCPDNADVAVTPFSLRSNNVLSWIVNLRNVSTWTPLANQTINVLVYIAR